LQQFCREFRTRSGGMAIALDILESGCPSRWRLSEEGVPMLQMLLADWIVRFFLLYLIVLGGLVFIRRERQTVVSPFIRLSLADIRERWAIRGAWCAASHGPWWDKYHLRDKHAIRIGLREQSDETFWRNGNGLSYA
jgi:hypothetical protein